MDAGFDVNGLILIRDHLPDAFIHSIQTDVLFKWICAGEIVIAIVSRLAKSDPRPCRLCHQSPEN